jgi:hypothetical protein
LNDVYNFCKIDKAEHIVGGVICRSNVADLDGDVTTEKETWGALKNFMLGRKNIKINHRGQTKNIPVVEAYFSEQKHKKGNGYLEKGDWYLSLFIGDEPEIWQDILSEKLCSFSMAGRADKL